MTGALILICLWVVLAFVFSAVPSNNSHWRRAYILLALGVPVLLWVTWHGGLLAGLIGLGVGCLVLRWPVFFLWRWLRRKSAG